MDDMEDDAGYPPHPLHRRINKHPGRTFPIQDLPPPRLRYSRSQDDEEVEEDEEFEVSEAEEDPGQNGVDEDEENEDDDNDDQEDGGDDEDGRDDDDDDEDEDEEERDIRSEQLPLKRRRKKRRLDRLALGFEFAPRAAAAASVSSISRLPPRNSPADWTEDSTFVLLDAWGDLYLQNGRKSIRSEDWAEVARKVSQSSRNARSETQCRNRLDTLKKKYKKEKMKMSVFSNSSSDWIYFSKMDSLLSPPAPSSARLACGFDSGEYVFTNSRIYASRSNDLDEMRDTPADSECEEDDDEDDESDGLPPATTKSKKESSFRMLAESIKKFGEIYEKMEISKRQHMAELERMRKEFHADLELQKRQILERAQAEIDKLRQNSDAEEEGEEDAQEQDGEAINDEDEEMDASLEEGSA